MPESPLVDQTEPSLEDIAATVKRLKKRKSPGACDIPAEDLLAFDDNSMLLLHHTIRLLIWRTRTVLSDMRKATIVPIFKKGNRSDCANYRGISLLFIAGKVLTSLIRVRLNDLYEQTLRDRQGGFRKGRGCIDQIFSLRQALKRRKSTVVCFIDFAAAFDSPHRASNSIC